MSDFFNWGKFDFKWKDVQGKPWTLKEVANLAKFVTIGGGVVAGGVVLKNLWEHEAFRMGVWTTLGTAATATATLAGLKIYQTFKPEEVTAIRIKPKESIKVDPQRVAVMTKEFRQLYKFLPWLERVWIRWQIVRQESGSFEFRVIVPTKHKDVVKKRLGLAFVDVTLTEETLEIPSFYDPSDGESAHLKLRSKEKGRGLRSDLGNDMGDILIMMQPGSIMEITFSPTSISRIRNDSKKLIKSIQESIQESKKGKDESEMIEAIRERYKDNRTAFDVFIDVWGMYGVKSLIGELSARTEGLNKLNGRPYRILKTKRNKIKQSRFRKLAKWQKSTLTDRELASFLMLPPKGHPVWEHIPTEFIKPQISTNDFRGEYGIGYIDSDQPDQNGRVAGLKVDTLTNHGLIAGASGGGKGSTLMMLFKMGFLQKWLKNKPNSLGMTLCDPHTEDIYLILSHILDLEAQGVKIPWERVKVVSFGEIGAKHFPVAANLLHLPKDSDLNDIDRIAGDTEEVILSAFDSGQLSKSVSFLKKAVQGLLYSGEDHSMLDIVRLFEHSMEADRLRFKIIQSLANKNDRVGEWWRDTHAEINKSERNKPVDAIDTRLSPLLDEVSMQRFFVREGNYFEEIPKWLEDGCLVLIDFKGAQKEMFRLCAAWLAKQYFRASQARGTGGRPHLLMFDEVQKFDATEIFFNIITENRKFDLGLILLTQMVEELDQRLATAIKSNAGFVVSVRQEDGAKPMQNLLDKPFTVEELKNLEKGLEACIRSFDGKARLKLDYPAFVLNSQPTERKSEEENQAKRQAHQKFMELLERDHLSASQADQEIKRFVLGEPVLKPVQAAQSEAAASSEPVSQSTPKPPQPKRIKRVK